jgi:hypothetical protein
MENYSVYSLYHKYGSRGAHSALHLLRANVSEEEAKIYVMLCKQWVKKISNVGVIRGFYFYTNEHPEDFVIECFLDKEDDHLYYGPVPKGLLEQLYKERKGEEYASYLYAFQRTIGKPTMICKKDQWINVIRQMHQPRMNIDDELYFWVYRGYIQDMKKFGEYMFLGNLAKNNKILPEELKQGILRVLGDISSDLLSHILIQNLIQNQEAFIQYSPYNKVICQLSEQPNAFAKRKMSYVLDEILYMPLSSKIPEGGIEFQRLKNELNN